ncbi:hypothetical protein WUBG_01147 [Wuchereria bancrofti]|uniref:Uncharacterized protein n=1 Tax=Wuchereria bancrofti TaxID=6293 RepID=J9FKP2_WUCBA|nr:hypothetical protein WUBG_01147 [Wuchereria bancrofti]
MAYGKLPDDWKDRLHNLNSLIFTTDTVKRSYNLNEKFRKQTFKCCTFTSRTETVPMVVFRHILFRNYANVKRITANEREEEEAIEQKAGVYVGRSSEVQLSFKLIIDQRIALVND